MMGFGLDHLVCEVEQDLTPVEEIVRAAGRDEVYVQQVHNNGLRRIPVARQGSVAELIQRVLQRLTENVPNLHQRVCGVLLGHSLATTVPPDMPLLDKSMQAFHLQQVPKLAVSGQPCSVMHFVVQLAGAWLAAVPEGDILVLGVDKAQSAEERVFFGSTMGDAAIAMLITRHSARHRIMSSISQTYSLTYAGENSPPEDIARFRLENPHRIRLAVHQALAEADIQLDDVSYIIPHTPYNLIWDVMAELLRFPRERIMTDYLCETGHLNSNDVFVHFERALREGKINTGQIVILISPGFGGTRGCTIIQV